MRFCRENFTCQPPDQGLLRLQQGSDTHQHGDVCEVKPFSLRLVELQQKELQFSFVTEAFVPIGDSTSGPGRFTLSFDVWNLLDGISQAIFSPPCWSQTRLARRSAWRVGLVCECKPRHGLLTRSSVAAHRPQRRLNVPTAAASCGGRVLPIAAV